jgi:hypothetical protein
MTTASTGRLIEERSLRRPACRCDPFLHDPIEATQRPVVAEMDRRIHHRPDDVADDSQQRFLLDGHDGACGVAHQLERDDSGDEWARLDHESKHAARIDVEHFGMIGDRQPTDSDAVTESRSDVRPGVVHPSDARCADQPVGIGVRVDQYVPHR